MKPKSLSDIEPPKIDFSDCKTGTIKAIDLNIDLNSIPDGSLKEAYKDLREVEKEEKDFSKHPKEIYFG